MAWVPLAMMAAGAVAGHQKQKQQQAMADSDRKLASETARYSPWTGMTPGQIRNPENSAFGATLGGGIAGYSQGAGMQGAMGGGQQTGGMSPAQQSGWAADSSFNNKFLAQKQPATRTSMYDTYTG